MHTPQALLAPALCAALLALSACGAGTIGGNNTFSGSDDGGVWPGSDSLNKQTGPEQCNDGLDNDGDGEVDEQCACDPTSQATQACYPGPPATQNVGQCKDGTQTCVASGTEFSSWDNCSGAVLPGVEDCSDGKDNDCNGTVDDGPGCACKPGQTRACYSGPPATKDVGACESGTQTCNAGGTAWSTGCAGEALPGKEVCGDNLDNDCDGLVDEGCTSVQAPQSCTVSTMKHVTGSADCPKNSAVYMMDDGMGPNFICCPLPATDILDTSVPPVTSTGYCSADHVIVGYVSPLVYRCQKINTKRYTLGVAAKPCYFGSGWSGSAGTIKCAGHPYTFSALQQNYFGSDGCSGFPYGSLFTQQTGKDCSDMRARQLLYAGATGDPAAGTPVVMYK